ncbi:MAG: hypothetical protein WD988_01500 [Candidatus Curtissbacteria bacterium]
MAAIKLIFIIGIIAGIIIVANTVLRSNGSQGLLPFLPAGADQPQQNGRPLETVPELIQNNP